MSRYDSYEEVKALSLDVQRELLRRGDNEERIWATWAVAAELGGGFAPDLDRQAVAEPTAGVRRHMIVVLAGMGEYALLREFAERDPVALVRATGCQYVLRTMTDAHEARNFCFVRMETDASRDVWMAVASEAIRKADVLTLEDLVALASNEVMEIRTAAVREIACQGAVASALKTGLSDCFLTESDDDLLGRLVDLAVEGGHASDVLSAAGQSGDARRMQLLDLLIKQDQRFGWSQLQTLAEDSPQDADIRLVSLLDEGDSRQALSWLVARLARRVRDGVIEDRLFEDVARKALETATEQFLVEPTSLSQADGLAVIRAWMEKKIEEYEHWQDWDDYYDEQECEAAKAADLDLLNKIDRLSERAG